MAFPTLSRKPSSLDPDGTLEDVVLRSPFDAGYEQTRPKTTRARRNWGVTYDELPDADVATLRTYEQATLVNGSAAFDWTHPKSGTTFTVRLVGMIKYSSAAGKYGVSVVSFLLREV